MWWGSSAQWLAGRRELCVRLFMIIRGLPVRHALFSVPKASALSSAVEAAPILAAGSALSYPVSACFNQIPGSAFSV